MFDTIEPQEPVTEIAFGRIAHLLQTAAWITFIYFGISFAGTLIATIVSIIVFAFFLMGFRQKVHFYSDRVKIKLTACQPTIAPYSDIKDISVHKKKLTITFKSKQAIALDLSLDSKRKITAIQSEFNKKLFIESQKTAPKETNPQETTPKETTPQETVFQNKQDS